MDLEVALEALQRLRWVELFRMEPVQLLVDVLLREDKDLELFTLNEVGAFGNLLDKHAQQIAAFLQEILAVAPEALLLGQCWNVKTR